MRPHGRKAIRRSPQVTVSTANSLILLPEGPATYERGEEVTVQVLDWESAVNEE